MRIDLTNSSIANDNVTQRTARIRKLIARGEYAVNLDTLARRIVDALGGELGNK